MKNINDDDMEDQQRSASSNSEAAGYENERTDFFALSPEDGAGRSEIEIFTPQELDLDFDNLTVEALEQRLELAIGKIVLPGPLENCVDNFNCAGFSCGVYTCGGFS